MKRASSPLRIRGASAVVFAWGLAALGGPAARAGAPPVGSLRSTPDPAAPASVETTFKQTIAPLLRDYCYDCHGDGEHKGDVALDSYADAAAAVKDRKTWELVLHNLRAQVMPPGEQAAQPTAAERETIAAWIEKALYHFDPEHPDPGRVTLRRLNRAEYNATIRDLVGVDFAPAADFPPDDSGYGFDNIGDVLSLPPSLLEKYLAAADKIMDQALSTEPVPSRKQRIPASLAQVGFNALGDRGDGWIQLVSLEEDDVAMEVSLPVAGDYIFRVQAFAKPTGGALAGQGSSAPVAFKDQPPPTKLTFLLNDAVIRDFDLTTDEQHPGVYEARIGVPAGRERFRAAVMRVRGGDYDLTMLNGRLGKQQPGIGLVKWLEVEGPLQAATHRWHAADLPATGAGRSTAAGARVFEHNGGVTTTITATRDGDYLLRAQAYASQAGADPARMEFRLDGKPLQTFDVRNPGTMEPLPGQRVFSLALLVPIPQVYEAHVTLPPGAHQFTAAFTNEFADPANKNPNLRLRSLTVQNLEVSSLGETVPPPPLPAPLRELFARHQVDLAVGAAAAGGKTPPTPAPAADTARAILADFTRRAWRGPVAPVELDRLMKLYDLARAQGDTFEGGVKLAMKAVLVSPHFLFLGEPRTAVAATGPAGRPEPAGPDTGAVYAAPVPLDEHTLASRLSYFLWSSQPDDELLDLADRGRLHANFTAQVRRMLASPKARALVDNFAGQWLQFRSLETFQPDKTLFPGFDPPLRDAMQHETELFFEHIMRDDRSVFDFLTGNYTYVNGRLAKFYGLPGVEGEEFQRVSLDGTPRRGVLTQGSVLTLTSNPTRTSPVKRGKWVLENLLGTPPPPPPPNVPALDDEHRKLTGTLRQQMEQHRANPACAACHARMDPIGFGLENFDATGAWRDQDAGVPIDASGQLVTGDKFAGAAGLAALLATKRRTEFLHCLADKMLTYALGRGTEYYDRPALDEIVRDMDRNNDRFSSLILAVAQSLPFQMRRSAGAASGTGPGRAVAGK
jgi:hypothetical protein